MRLTLLLLLVTGVYVSAIASTTLTSILTSLAVNTPAPTLPATRPLICSTTTFKPTTLCFQTSKSRTCIPTQTPISFCHPTNVCFKNKNNEDTCKIRDNTVAPAGIALAIIVPTVIVIIAISLVVMRFRDKKARARARAARAAEGGEERSVRFEKDNLERRTGRLQRVYGRPGSPDGVPLIEIQPPPAYAEHENGVESQAGR